MATNLNICAICNLFLDCSYGPPCTNFQNNTICSHCVNTQGFNITETIGDPNSEVMQIDQIAYIELRKEVLYADCGHELQAFFMHEQWFILYCRECRPKNENSIISFSRQSPRAYLTGLLENALTGNYPYELKQIWRNRITSAVSDIHKCIKEKFFFDMDAAICLEHYQYANGYNCKDFIFKCGYCKEDENTAEYPMYFENIVLVIREFLKTAKTTSLISTVVIAIRDSKFDKNVLYCMRYVKSEASCSLSSSATCPICFTKFALGPSYPIKLHEEELHEICYSCYKKYQLSNCFIDNFSVNSKISPANPSYLFNVASKMCGFSHSDNRGRFSYYEKVVPYHICCQENMCGTCREVNTTSVGATICKQCGSSKVTSQITQNKYLLNQLKHTEVRCENPEHKGKYAEYFNDVDIVVYCKSCIIPGRYRAARIPDKFNTRLLEEIQKNLQVKALSKIMIFCIREIFIYPIMTKLRLLRNLQKDCENDLVRFNTILPTSFESINQWSANPGIYERILISCKGMLEIKAFLIGCALQMGSYVEIYMNGSQVAQSQVNYNTQERYQRVFLSESVLIKSEPLEFCIRFTQGNYHHGLPSPSLKDLNYNGVKIIIGSPSMANGNNIIGGPIIGFTFAGFYLPEEEL